ncbi:MAG: hypothetical protein COZ11_11700, partial [Deltaproteobacteria bacterium CG_4_10_14_3_um_filter_51_14]
CIPVVKIIARLELDETISFPDGHYLSLSHTTIREPEFRNISLFWAPDFAGFTLLAACYQCAKFNHK